MTQKGDKKQNAGTNGEELLIRCFDLDCEYVSYNEMGGKKALWCSKEKKVVYDIERCPFEKWFRDEKGKIHRK